MPFPSVLNSFNRPAATDKLNSPSHSALHNIVSSAVGQIEQTIGLSTTSVIGSLFYDIRSPDSNGGGHVQSANKGGTGQTSFNKGDILVATSSSVVAKLAVGLDGRAIVADSSVAAGLKYAGVATEKELQDQTYIYASASVLSASVYGITFPNIVSVLSAGQAFAVKFPTAPAGSILALSVSSLVARRIVMPDLSNPPVGIIRASMISILENDGTNWQLQNTPPASSTVSGLVPTPPNNTTTFLRGDATFASVFAVTAVTGTAPVVSSGGVTPAISVPAATASVSGLVPTPPNNTNTFLRGDATFASVVGGVLGNWSVIGLTDTAIQSTTHAFIVGYAPVTGGTAAINILTDSNATPTTVRASIVYGGTGVGPSWCVPVKKDDYFIASGTSGTCYKIPLS